MMNIDNFNLNDFFNNNKVNDKSNSNEGTTKKCTQSQKDLYLNLCNRKNQPVAENYEDFSITQMSDEITRLNAIKQVKLATSKQIDTILDLVNRLGIKTPDTSKLSISDASNLISSLIALDKKNRNGKPSEQQLKFVADMQICPDVPGISEQELSTMSKLEVSEYIEAYKGAFYEWKSSRLTPEQASFIRELQKRIGDYEMSDAELIQFSKETANQYISQLQRELKDKTSIPQEPTVDDVRKAKTQAEAAEKNAENLIEMIHNLYAVIGQEAEDDVLFETENEEDIHNLINLVNLYTDVNTVKTICEKFYTEDEVEKILNIA
jgi:hypothetical protein